MSFSDLCCIIIQVLLVVPGVVLGVLVTIPLALRCLLNVIQLLALQIIVIIPWALFIVFFPLDADGKYDPDMFLISDIVGVALDALFLYIPLVDDDIKCLVLDNSLKKVVVIFRSLSDLRYLLRIAIRVWSGVGSCKQISRLTTEIFALLPIPQIIILIYLPTMRGSKSLNTIKLLNSLIVLQYLSRVIPIYNICRHLNNKTILNKYNIPREYGGWIPSLINFIIYILASHVLGAFWYYFSIQREIDCWEVACRNQSGCEFSTSCNDRSFEFKNITLTNNLCSINQPEATTFDFGIFLEALQSGIQGSTNFPQKFLQCFSWGLRNLSSFASNLNTSSYGWETLFVVLISISGLILFIYLLGHMQTFMQATKKSDRIQQKMKMIMEPKIRSMLSDYGLPSDMETKIKSQIEYKLEEDEDVNEENIYPILNSDLKETIKHHLFLDKLKKIPKLTDMDGNFLDLVCEYLEPMMYHESSYIIREGEPVDKMFFMTRGIAMTYTTNNGGSRTIQLEKERDYLYGEELLSWAAAPSSKLSDLPISTITVKSLGKVQVFALNAAEFQDVVSRFPSYVNTDTTLTEIAVDINSSDISASRWGHVSRRAQGYESC